MKNTHKFLFILALIGLSTEYARSKSIQSAQDYHWREKENAHKIKPIPTLNLKNELLSAIKLGDLEKVKLLLPKTTNKMAKNRALFEAISVGNIEILKEILKYKVDVNKDTPLGFAISLGRLDVIEELLKAGANINAKEDDLDTMIKLASISWNKKNEILEIIREWVIQNQIPIEENDDKKILDKGIPGSFESDFKAYKDKG